MHHRRQPWVPLPQEFFRPELLNRVDATVVLRPLARPALRGIAARAVEAVAERLLQRRRIRLHVAPCLVDHICSASADQVALPPRPRTPVPRTHAYLL